MMMFRAELWFLSRDRAALFWLVLALAVSVFAVYAGLDEVRSQRATLSRMLAADTDERQDILRKQKDWGSAAYYAFHLTYDPPSPFAFAALGQRDTIAWKHRIRMLALEGQIYERDAANPSLALTGRFDFAFVASILLPLFVVFLLHAQRSKERAAGRLELLTATAVRADRLWFVRGALRMGALATCIIAPLVVGGWMENSHSATLTMAGAATLLHIAFWWLVTDVLGRFTRTSAVSLMILVGIWFAVAVLWPACVRFGVARAWPVPEGGQILLTQREAVNAAWDRPKTATMALFVERHPQWREHATIRRPFEWKWYYAFQQVGDQSAESLSRAYIEGRQRRDHLAGWMSLPSPPAWLARTLQSLAATDVSATLAYEQSVRDFHAKLRAYYYPKLFEDRPFEPSALPALPRFNEPPNGAPP